MPERIDFWGIPQPLGPILVYLFLTLGVLVLIARLAVRVRKIVSGNPSPKRWDRPIARLKRVLDQALLQARTLEERYPGRIHLAISVSFLLFFMGTALATLNGHFIPFLRGHVYLIYKLVLDLASLAFLVGAGFAFYRRLAIRPKQLTLTKSFIVTLVFLCGIVLNGLLVEGLRLSLTQPEWIGWTPVGAVIARGWLLTGIGEGALHSWHQALYSVHVLTVTLFFVTLPDSNLIHLISAPLNIFFSDLEEDGARLPEIGRKPTGEPLLVRRLADLSWKAHLDGEACTECGRCQDACPAYAAGTPLNPKEVILSLRDTSRHLPADTVLVSTSIISAEALWACMACGACIQVCPVMIEHIDTIVELRREQVDLGLLDSRLQQVLVNARQLGSTESRPRSSRTAWAAGLKTAVKDARVEPVEWLWLLGDTLTSHEDLYTLAVQTAEVFTAAGLSFGTLGDGEENDGNDLRRTGEEGLFKELVRRNSEALRQAKFQGFVTTDPHLLNTIRHEYPASILAGRPVVHAAELVDRLVADGRLKFTTPLNLRVTYHDPCYLGRFNHVHDLPRRLIRAAGCELVEMPHNRCDTICCGAGGGRMWMSEGQMVQRPADRRLLEAASLPHVSTFVVACPKDMIMFSDAARNLPGQPLAVRDVIELVHTALGLK